VTAHSHFRYGTIHWEPGALPNEAVFTVNAAFRKQYNWGAYHKVRIPLQVFFLPLDSSSQNSFFASGLASPPPTPA
jgi:hypothetical protein